MRSIQFGIASLVTTVCLAGLSTIATAQNYERYKPLDIPNTPVAAPDLSGETKLPDAVEDDRILVPSLDAIIVVDRAEKIDTSERIDDLSGVSYDFDSPDTLVHCQCIRRILDAQIGQPITLRQLNKMARDIILEYRRCKLPIVDVIIPEQRITTGTLYIVVVESCIGSVKIQSGCFHDCQDLAKWIECTRVGNRIYEPNIESDLFWLNQSPFYRTNVDFQKGSQPGTTDVIYKVRDIRPIRGYIGIDDSGVQTLNYGRFFAGAQVANLAGRGGVLGYQYTSDEDFRLLQAHSASYLQSINRDWAFQTFGSYAMVRPMMSFGLSQTGESYQLGTTLKRHLIFDRAQQRNINFGYDFKSTNNALEFDQTRISQSNADLFQLRLGIDDYIRYDIDQYRVMRFDTFTGPGGSLTGANSTAAFNTIRPGTGPDYFYARAYLESANLIGDNWLMATRLTGQAASRRLLFSETLGLGGFDTVRGFDQRSFNADDGVIANFELGPRTYRWGCQHNPQVCRAYSFIDMGNGYVRNARPGENAYAFIISTGVGARYQMSDRLIARFDLGTAIRDDENFDRSTRAHFGLTWIPGKRL